MIEQETLSMLERLREQYANEAQFFRSMTRSESAVAIRKRQVAALDTAIAALRAQPQREADETAVFAWLIESGTNPPTYWDGRHLNHQGFTPKDGDALRFARFEDAEVVRCWLIDQGVHYCKSVQHGWSNGGVPNDSR